MRRSDSIFRNSWFFFAARLVDLISGIGGFILVAHFLGVTGLGDYSFIITFIVVLGLVVNLGIDHIIIRELARDRDSLPRLAGNAIKLKLRLLLIAAPLMAGGLFLFHPGRDVSIAIIFLFTAHLLLREVFTIVAHAVFLACEKMEYRASTTLVFQILRLAGIVIALVTGNGLKTIFATIIIADIVQALQTMHILKKHFGRLDFSGPKSEMWYLFKQALPMGIAFGFTNAFIQLDILLLKSFHGSEEVGIYSSAYRFVSQFVVIIIPLIWIVLPHLTRTYRDSREALKREGEFYLKVIAWLMFSAGLTMSVYSSWLIKIFPSDYMTASVVLAIVAPTLIFRGLGYLFDLSFIAAEKQKMVALTAGIAFSVKLILELILIPKYGFRGAAWGTFSAEIIAFTCSYLLIRKYVVNYSLLRTAVKPLLAALLTSALLIFVLKPYPLIGIPLGFIVFTALVFLFGTFDKAERESIYSLIRRKAASIGRSR